MRKPLLILSAMVLPNLPCHANTFGVADARTQALGGTSVALGSHEQGFFYNPALVALHKGNEDRTRDGRISLSFLADGLSDGAQTAAEAITDDLEGQLSQAIADLNNSTDIESARTAIIAARELGNSMRELQEQNIYADLYAGLSISEPGDMEGGAFFLGSRLLAGGVSNIEEADLDLLDDYLEALSYIESFGTEGQQHPELLDENGDFINPSDNIQSSASGSALLVTETGISTAFQIQLWQQTIALGVSPKVVYLRSYDERWGIEDGDFSNQSAKENLLYLNFDTGLLWSYDDKWRVGVAVKDVLAKRWRTNLGQTFHLKPKARLGLAYAGKLVRIGLDYDLDKLDHIQTDQKVQIASLGLEWQVLPRLLALRAGYRHDLEDTLGSSTSAGFALKLGDFAAELAVSDGDNDLGAALQLSWYQ